MAEVGLTHGGFYAHFSSKEELIAAAIDEIIEERIGIFSARYESMEPSEALARYIDSYLSYKHVEKVETGCPIPALAADAPRLSSLPRERFAIGIERLRKSVANLFERLGHDKKLAIELATSLLAELAGAVSMARAADSTKNARDVCDLTRATLRKRFGLAERATFDARAKTGSLPSVQG